MSVGTGVALTLAGIGAAGSVASAAIGAHAAGKAAQQQTQAEQQALDFQKQVYGQQVQNEQPYVQAGQYSIGKLMGDLKSGTFGAGSNPAFSQGATFQTPAPFTAPTAAQAAATPGYQFTFDQGMRGVNASAAARGGALSGGAIKAAAQFGTGLADTTYNDVFNRSLQGYQTNFQDTLAGYQTNFQDSLAAYQANLARQAQEYGQESGVAALGQSGIQSIGNVGTGAATNVGNIMSQIGNAQAAGTVGQANAWSQGIGGAANAASQGILLSNIGNIIGAQPNNILQTNLNNSGYYNPSAGMSAGIFSGDSIGGSNPFGG